MKEENLFNCDVCGLHYDDKETVDECSKFCLKNHACSVEITRKSEEHKKLVAKRETT